MYSALYSFSVSKIRPPKDIQTQIYCERFKSIDNRENDAIRTREWNVCIFHNITSLKYIRKFFPESVVVENTKDENYNKFNCKHKTFRFVCIERSVVEETVAVAVYEKVNRIDKHELVEKRRIKAVGVVHNTR